MLLRVEKMPARRVMVGSEAESGKAAVARRSQRRAGEDRGA